MKKKKQGMIDAEKAEIRVGILRSLKKLVDGGYLEKVEPVELSLLNTDEKETNKNDKKRKLSSIVDENDTNTNDVGHKTAFEDELKDSDDEEKKEEFEQDLAPSMGIPPDDYDVLALLRKHPNSRMFPIGSVWRVNIDMFHNVLRALILGHLVKERYEDKVPAAGSIITAALKLIAYEEHAPKKYALSQAEKQRREEEKGIFSAEELMNYIPTPVLHAFKNKAGGGKSNIHMALVALSQLDWPQVIMEVEGGRFELATRQMVKYLQGRILHQVVKDHMGDVAARICSLLEVKGYLEPDAIAKSAMVPAQDAREVLHKLFREKYVSYLCLSSSKQYISSSCLRRQHEMAVGKDWIERAKEAGANDENDHEEDKINYQKFCEGLLRLDSALLQLDETLMVLRDL